MILTPVEMNELEIEYRATGARWNEEHMAVRERQGAGDLRYAAHLRAAVPRPLRVPGAGKWAAGAAALCDRHGGDGHERLVAGAGLTSA